MKAPLTRPVFRQCGKSTGGDNTILPFPQVRKATPANPIKVVSAPPVAAGDRFHVNRYILGACLVLVSFVGFWAGRPAAPRVVASNAGNDAALEIQEETQRAVAEWEEQVSELNARLSETSVSQEKVSDELRLARELREEAERRLHDCKAYGPEYC